MVDIHTFRTVRHSHVPQVSPLATRYSQLIRSFRASYAYTSVLINRIASSLVLLTALASVGAQVKTNQITPGKQLGKLNVGELMETMKWLKKPDYGDSSSGHQWQTWEAKKPDPRNGKILNTLDVYSSINEAGKYQIRLIRSTSPTFSTTAKIKVGTTYRDVLKAFPKIVKLTDYASSQFSTKVDLYDDATTGIAFEFKPGPDGAPAPRARCLSIWVHEPGLDMMKEYYPPVEYITTRSIHRRAAKRS
jgi:hypothetical protein